MAEHKRPLLVTLIAVIFLLLGLFGLFSGIVFVVTGVAVGTDMEAFAGLAGGGMAVLGLIYLIIAVGFLKGWSLWWYLGILFSIVGIVLGLLAFPAGLVATVLSIIVLWYLFRDNVKRFFLD